jgi:hypothetical protein
MDVMDIDHYSLWTDMFEDYEYSHGFNMRQETLWMSLHDCVRSDLVDTVIIIELVTKMLKEDGLSNFEENNSWLMKSLNVWMHLVMENIPIILNIISENIVKAWMKRNMVNEDEYNKLVDNNKKVEPILYNINENLKQLLEQMKNNIDDDECQILRCANTKHHVKLLNMMANLKDNLMTLSKVISSNFIYEENIFNNITKIQTPEQVHQLEYNINIISYINNTTLAHIYRRNSEKSLLTRMYLINKQLNLSYISQTCCLTLAFSNYEADYLKHYQWLKDPLTRDQLLSGRDLNTGCWSMFYNSCKNIDVCYHCHFGKGLRCCVCLPSICYSYYIRDTKRSIYNIFYQCGEDMWDCCCVWPQFGCTFSYHAMIDGYYSCSRCCHHCYLWSLHYFCTCDDIKEDAIKCWRTKGLLVYDTCCLVPRVYTTHFFESVYNFIYLKRDCNKDLLDCYDFTYFCCCVRPQVYCDGCYRSSIQYISDCSNCISSLCCGESIKEIENNKVVQI